MSLSFSSQATATAGRWAAAAASRWGGPRLSILIFHRVLKEPDPLFPAESCAKKFEQQMAMVARSFEVLPLDKAVQKLSQGELPPRALAITFDDGYADNHDVALPILQRLGLSATVYVSTGFLDGGRMWNDSVIECLRHTQRDQLDLSDWGLPALPTVTAPQRRAAIDALVPIIKYKAPAEREVDIQRLHTLCGQPALSNCLMMQSKDVHALHRAGIGIGAHTVHHPILCSLPDAQAEQEIAQSRDRLQDIVQAPVTQFAYPNGKHGRDYDDRHAAICKRLGFAAAVATTTGVSRAGDDLFHLRRFTPWDSDPLRWSARLTAHHLQS
jgi:peptidoglycan/xylan/chitin deacetylase (PgdA/CDA1 family)